MLKIGEDGICVAGDCGGGVFFGGLYIGKVVRFMMMMVCTYEIYGNGKKKEL